MSSTTLFEMPFSEFQLKNAVSSALQQSLNYPTQFSIESNLEAAVRNYVQENLNSVEKGEKCEFCSHPPFGVKSMFKAFLIIEINYKVSYKVGIAAGLEFRAGAFTNNNFIIANLYNSGLGTPIYDNDRERRIPVLDVTVGSSIFIGSDYGNGIPMNNFTINSYSPMPIQNFYKFSLGYSMLGTWNSAINNGTFSLNDIQRQGVWNLRIGNFTVSTNNDTKRAPYWGKGTDYGFTGGLTINFAIANFGTFGLSHDTFTGKFRSEGEPELYQENILQKKEKILNSNLSEEEKKLLLDKCDNEWSEYLKNNSYHTQNEYQKKFNRATNSFEFSEGSTSFFNLIKNSNQVRIEVDGIGKGQNIIHREGANLYLLKINPINDLKFDYSRIKELEKKPRVWINLRK
ncbi:hypothetical protein ABC895_12860 [Capnocytophaga sputigena]|uniref:hypothetical protein n=1 Tax=Capnocytophaga sputigena TaxID=1019 RepID=UPI0031F49481